MTATGSPLSSLRTCFCLVLWVSETQDLLGHASGGRLKRWDKPFTPEGEAGIYGFPLDDMSPCSRSGFMVRSYLSLSPFQCVCVCVCVCVFVFSFFHLMCRSHTANFWISFRGNCSVCSSTFSVSMGEGELRNLLCHLPGSLPSLIFYLIIKYIYFSHVE